MSCLPRCLSWRALLALFMGASLGTFAAGPVVLNEVLANNESAVPFGEFHPDYVELYNTSSEPVSLAGARLIDASPNSVPLVFSANHVIPPGGRLLVWCDRDTTLEEPQARFGLGAGSDRLRLTGPDGVVWDELAFGIQAEDLAIGRVPDGTGSWVLIRPSPEEANEAVTLGEPNALFINEWMAAPDAGDDWLELYNQSELPVALTGLVLTDSLSLPAQNRPIPALSFIAPGGFVQFFASDLEELDADHLDFRLSSTSETLTLLAADRTTILDRIEYGQQSPNTSQGRAPDGSDNILTFGGGLATPGASNIRELTRVVISEVLSHTDDPLEDAIELQNVSDAPVDISHWWLSDSGNNPQKFRIPPGTILPPGGFIVFYQLHFDNGPNAFALNSYEGDDVWLSTGDANGQLTGEITSVRFGALKNGVSVGRVMTSAGVDFAPLSRRTFGEDTPVSLSQFRQGRGLSNAPPASHAIKISEIFFQPSANAAPGQGEPFIELHNTADTATPLFDPAFPTNAWRIRGAIRFNLPTGIELAPDARLLITSFNPETDTQRAEAFRTANSIPAEVRILGPWEGNLASWESHLELQLPDSPEGPNKPRPGFVPYVRVERVAFTGAAPWPSIPSGSGQALQRSSPEVHSNDPAAWSAGPPSPGRESSSGGGDRDGDGMPDDWEVANGFNPDLASDALEDADSDGLINRDEFIAGTDPRNPNESLSLTADLVSAGALEISFNAVAGRAYRLEGLLQPPGDTWQVVTNIPVQAANSVVTVQSPLGEGSQLFRLVLETAP